MLTSESLLVIEEEVPIYLVNELIFREAQIVTVDKEYLLWSGILLHKSLVPFNPGLFCLLS
jgi:hypothetical protein